jgi:hypothetical protein
MFTVQESRIAQTGELRASVAYGRSKSRWLFGSDIINRAHFVSEPK